MGTIGLIGLRLALTPYITNWVSSVDIIHLFPLHNGDVKIFFVHPRKVIFPEGNARGKYDYFEGEHIFISPLWKGNECFIPQGQRFGEFCQMKSFYHLCLQTYYFGTSLELSLLTWNTVVPRDCFDQSNFYIRRINIIGWNNSY